MKLNKMILAAAAVVLPLSIGVGSALAYFTDNVSSVGGYAVEVGAPDTEITETFGDWTKHVTIRNTGEVPVYVRVRAFSGGLYPLTYSGTGWTKNGDYYEYHVALGVGETTSGLDIKIEGVPQDATDRDAFNVVVVYERTPAVQYMEDGSVKLDDKGNPIPDWNYSVKQESEFPTDSKETVSPEVPEEPAEIGQTEGGDES